MGEDAGEAFRVDAPGGVLKVGTDLGFRVERLFESACNELLNGEPENLKVDLDGVRYICSSCLGMLFLLQERAKLRGKSVSVRVHRSVAPICELMGLRNFIEFEVFE